MLDKSNTLSLVKRALIGYNDLVLSQIASKISEHNTDATTSAKGHMTIEQVSKLNGISAGAEVNQNAISSIQMGDAGTVTATTKTATAKFIAGNNISYSVDNSTGAITISSSYSDTTYGVVSTTENGLAPKITNANGFLKGNATWVTIDKSYIGLGNVTNESKATMFSNPTFTGTVTVPDLTTVQTPTDNQAVNKKYVDTKVSGLIDSAPETLNTLNELAAALGDDPNFATTVATNIGKKADQTALNTTNGKVTTLETTVGSSTSGLVKDVSDLKTTVGSSTSGLVQKVNTNATNITNLQTKTDGFSGTIISYIDGLRYLTSETINDAEISTMIQNVKTTLNL